MIDSLFILTDGGKVVVRRHYGEQRSLDGLQYLLKMLTGEMTGEKVAPVVRISSAESAVHVLRGKLRAVVFTNAECEPLLLVSWLNEMMNTLEVYLDTMDEARVLASFTTVLCVIDELCDAGLPFRTEVSCARVFV